MKIKFVAILLSVLVISMTPVFAAQMNLTYDANGNKVSGDDGTYRVYNSLNQLWRVYNGSSSGALLQEYTYHPTEERVWAKIDFYPNGSVAQTTIYFDKNHVRVINASGSFDTLYIYEDGQLIAQKNSDGTTYFIVGDNIGSSTVVTNSSGAVIENDTYSPFGQQLSSSVVRYGYEAKEQDTVLGDTDFNFRKYNSNTMLFEQPDNQIQNAYDPQSLNHYSFERNNPYTQTDPNGHFFGIDDALVATAVAAVAAVAIFAGVVYAAGYAIGATAEVGYESSMGQNIDWNEVNNAGQTLGLNGAIASAAEGTVSAISANIGSSADAGDGTSSTSSGSNVESPGTPKIGTIGYDELSSDAKGAISNAEKGGPFKSDRDGIEFENRPDKETGVIPLPREEKGYYKEYTVAALDSTNRGPQRVVIGKNGEVYYTTDHYKTFKAVTPSNTQSTASSTTTATTSGSKK